MRVIPITLLALVLNGCGQSGPTLAGGRPVSHWLEALKHNSAEVRCKAVRKLSNVGPADESVLAALLGALNDRDARVRAEAVLGLCKFGPDAAEAVPALKRMQHHDPSPRVRSYAARASKRIQP